MLTNQEVAEATQVVNAALGLILGDKCAPRKREQVKLISEMLQTAIDACTVPGTIFEAIGLATGSPQGK